MSLKPEGINPVPEETARIAHAAYPKGNVFMHMRDELGTIYEDESFAPLFSPTGQPAEAPWRLALVTIMQFAEGLSDRQAADAVRGRIDWKYALGLELTDPGFDASVRSRVPHTAGRRSRRRTAFNSDAHAVRGTRLAQSARQTTDGFNACVGQDSCHQSTCLCGRNAAPCVELPGHLGT
jgi:transposase